MTRPPKLRWGIIGPGAIARDFAAGLLHSRTGVLVAIASRDPDRPGLAEAFPGIRRWRGYAALLADPDVDAVYIATPHPSHRQWAVAAAEAGKHVLVEKPMGLNLSEAEAIFAAARAAGTFVGEAYMYRFHPVTAKLCAFLASGVIGEVRLIKSSFGFPMPTFDPHNRIYDKAMAGGGILDIGGYPVSMARLIAGAISGLPFADPIRVEGLAHLGKSGVDEWASALLQFSSGLIAEISCAVSLRLDNKLRVFGSKGRLELADFWFGTGKEGGKAEIIVTASDETTTRIEINEPGWLYGFEADAVAEAINAGQQEFTAPGMGWADSIGNMKVLDAWRAGAGLHYDMETSPGGG